jgi:hypothetical protein
MSMKLPKNEENLERCSRNYIREIFRCYLAISAIARNDLFGVAGRKSLLAALKCLNVGPAAPYAFRPISLGESTIFDQQQNLNLYVTEPSWRG